MINLFIDLFVPKIDLFNELYNKINEKFPIFNKIISYIDYIMNSIFNSYNTNGIFITNFNEIKQEYDFSWYLPYKPFIDLLITGFSYLMFFKNLIFKLPNLIAGGIHHDN